MSFILAEDAISGKEGKAFISLEGRNIELLNVKDLEVSVKKKKSEFNVVGARNTQYKATGWEGEGSFTVYYVTSIFRKLMIEYMKTGKDFYFDITVVNEDPSSSIGKQTIVLKRCNLDEVVLASLDSDTEYLEEELSFTFEGADLLEEFKDPSKVGTN